MGRLGRFVWLARPVSHWLWPAQTFQCVQSVRPIQPPETDIFAGLTGSVANTENRKVEARKPLIFQDPIFGVYRQNPTLRQSR